jgi:hypothetical protein
MVTLVFGACGGGSSDRSSDRSSDNGQAINTSPSTEVTATGAPAIDVPPTEPAAAANDAAGEMAPAADVADDGVTAPASLQFTAPLVGGGELDAATLAGKPTLFWFWAPT